MAPTRTLHTIGLISSLALAGCSTTDTGATATLSGTETVTNPTNPSGDSDDSELTQGTNPTTDIGGEGTQAGSESTSGPTPETGTADTGMNTDPVTTETPPDTEPDPDTTTPGTDTGETTDTSEDGSTSTTSDDTTDTGDDTTGGIDPNCQAPAMQVPCDAGTNDIFKAIGLNCSADKTMAIPIKNPVTKSPANNAYRVTTHYGTAKDPMDPNKFMWGPKEGERLLAIGTGTFPALQNDGGLTEPDSLFGENVDTPNNNPDNLADLKALPGSVMTWAKGSNNGNGGTPFMDCDGVKDCSDTLDDQWNISPDNTANDMFYMSFDLEVPIGTNGYLFDFAYFSQEWPTYVDSPFNDMFVVWSTSESFTGNVTFIDEQPLTVTALDPYMAIQPGDPLLAGTGFPDSFIDTDGAGTGWFTAKASATPEESFTVAIAIFDMGDDILDTIGLIDNFRWDCKGCIPSEVDSCGIMPQ